jgi:hypothetical protein
MAAAADRGEVEEGEAPAGREGGRRRCWSSRMEDWEA